MKKEHKPSPGGYQNVNHMNSKGYSGMIDVSEKTENMREAIARGSIYMNKGTIRAISEGAVFKGDVISIAQIGGIMGAKMTSDIIPMSQSVNLYGADLDFKFDFENCKIDIEAVVKTLTDTGVEMEALTAVSVAALTIYDMCKAIDKFMVISDIHLVRKSSAKSGDFFFEKKHEDEKEERQ